MYKNIYNDKNNIINTPTCTNLLKILKSEKNRQVIRNVAVTFFDQPSSRFTFFWH